MNIGFDIDDTLTDNENYAQAFCENYFKRNNLNFNLVYKNTSLLTKMFDWSKEDFEKFWNIEGENFLSNAPVRPETKKVFEILKENGHKIFIITQRFFTKPYELSFNWLQKHGLKFNKLIVDAKDKVVACKEYKIDYFIDDRISTVEKLREAGINALVLNTYFNIDEQSTAPRVESLSSYLDIIETNQKQNELNF